MINLEGAFGAAESHVTPVKLGQQLQSIIIIMEINKHHHGNHGQDYDRDQHHKERVRKGPITIVVFYYY